MKQIFFVIMSLSSFLFPSCSHRDNKSYEELAETASNEQTIQEVVKGYLDGRKWHYRMFTDEDSTISFRLGFDGDNEHLQIQVNILPDNSLYQIIGQSDTKLPETAINNGILAMNDYNLAANVVSGCVSPKGDIAFWLGRNIDGNTFSEQAFAVDFHMVFTATDDETAHIYKQAVTKNI